jgi:4-amino-4-deoxy-L-arabinose transferase-like glycosyltransferase
MLVCGVLYFWRLGLTPLDDFDEAYYAAGAREMLERGDLLTPYYNGQPFLLKPVLIFWLTAAAFRIFGTDEFAARSVSAFFAAAIVLLTYWFGRATLSPRAAFLAALALAVCYLWIDTGREAMIDMPLTAALASAMFLFFLAVQAPPERKRARYLAAYPLLGVALLAKGPVAVGVVVAGFVAYLIAARRFRATLLEAQLLPGIALMLAVAAPWYARQALHQPEFVQTFLIGEHVGHLHGELARDEPWYGHLKNLFVGFYPWVAFLPGAAWEAFRRDRGREALRFAACWALTVLAVFSLGGAKLPHYLVPAFPAMALLVGGWLDRWLAREGTARVGSGVASALLGLTGVAAAALLAIAAIMPPALHRRLAEQFGSWTPGPAPLVMLAALAVGSLGAVVAAFIGRRGAVAPLLAGGMLVAATTHIGWFKPRIAEIQAQPRKELSQFASVAIPRSEPLGVFYAKRNATVFYARRPIVDLGEWEPDRLVSFLAPAEPAVALTHVKFLPLLEESLPEVFVWTRRGDFVLVANHRIPRVFSSGRHAPSPSGEATPRTRAP